MCVLGVFKLADNYVANMRALFGMEDFDTGVLGRIHDENKGGLSVTGGRAGVSEAVRSILDVSPISNVYSWGSQPIAVNILSLFALIHIFTFLQRACLCVQPVFPMSYVLTVHFESAWHVGLCEIFRPKFDTCGPC